MEETKVTDTNTKTQLSLAAALFFSPLVQNILNKSTRDITDKDREFIRWYIKLGYITLLLGVITIATWVLTYLFPVQLLSIIYTISIFVLIFLLIISIVSILSDISLVKWWTYVAQTYRIEGNKKDIILKYLPIYNIYLRYTAHSFDTPNWRIKESILLRTIFLVSSMLGSVFISSTILILIIIRVAALMSDIDFLPTPVKQRCNMLFFKNPEEIVWYITWSLVYLTKSFVHLFKTMQPYHVLMEITKEKEAYGRIIDIQDNMSIRLEYILWIILTAWLIYIIQPDSTVRTYYAWLWLLVLRYVLMAIQLKHLPHLPIAREILLLGHMIIFSTKKLFIHNH